MTTSTRTRYLDTSKHLYRFSNSVAYTQFQLLKRIPDDVHPTSLLAPSPIDTDSPAKAKRLYKADSCKIRALSVTGFDIISAIAETYVNDYAQLDDRIEPNRKDLLHILTSQETHASLGKSAEVAAPHFSMERAATAFRAEIGRVAVGDGSSTEVHLWIGHVVSVLITPIVDDMEEYETQSRNLSHIASRGRRMLRSRRPASSRRVVNDPEEPKSSSPPSDAAATTKRSVSLISKDSESPQTGPERPQVLGRSRKANSSIFIPKAQRLRIGHRYPGAPTKRIDNMWLRNPSAGTSVKKVKKARKAH